MLCRREPLAIRRSTSSWTSRAFKGPTPVELFGATEFPADRRRAVLPHPGPARLLLVRAEARRSSRRGEAPSRRAPNSSSLRVRQRCSREHLRAAGAGGRCRDTSVATLVRRQGAAASVGPDSSTPGSLRRRRGTAASAARRSSITSKATRDCISCRRPCRSGIKATDIKEMPIPSSHM